MRVISYRQSVFLLSMILPVTGHMLLLPIIFSFSEHNAWIAILLTVPFGFIFAFILFRLHQLVPTKTLVELMEQAFGRITGKILTTGLIVYFFYMLIISFYALYDFIQVIYLPETKQWTIGLLFYLVVLYAIYIGIEGISRFSEAIFLTILVTGTSVGIATQPYKDYKILFPLFDHGFDPILKGMLVTIALFGELIILSMLRLEKDTEKSKSLFFTNSVLIVLVTIMFVGTTISSLTIFGEVKVQMLEYPSQSIIRLVSFGFLERFDIYGIFVMTLGSLVRLSTFHIILDTGIRQWIGLKKKWFIHGINALVVFILSFTLIHNHRQFIEVYLTKYYYLTAIVSIGLPTLTWITLEIKRLIKNNTINQE